MFLWGYCSKNGIQMTNPSKRGYCSINAILMALLHKGTFNLYSVSRKFNHFQIQWRPFWNGLKLCYLFMAKCLACVNT